ncbi:hypothetical protein CDQ83_05605 [Clostridium thermosuccinogenes]|nr:hypothetical protein CDQ83_05605 [Pseudoclostridium thermosuccinogenes]
MDAIIKLISVVYYILSHFHFKHIGAFFMLFLPAVMEDLMYGMKWMSTDYCSGLLYNIECESFICYHHYEHKREVTAFEKNLA